MQRALDIYVDAGRFSVAAKAEKDIAEIYEAEGNLTEVRCTWRKPVSAVSLSRLDFLILNVFDFFSLLLRLSISGCLPVYS